MAKDKVTGIVSPAQLDEASLKPRVAEELNFIDKRRDEVKAANKEISAAFDRLDALGLDKTAIKAFLKRRKMDAEQRARFDRTHARLNQMDLFAEPAQAAA